VLGAWCWILDIGYSILDIEYSAVLHFESHAPPGLSPIGAGGPIFSASFRITERDLIGLLRSLLRKHEHPCAEGDCRRCERCNQHAVRPYLLYHRALLGDLSRVAARTITAFIRTTVGEPGLSVGIVASIQTHGSLANWHPHLHVLVTDGGFRADGTFVPLPLHDVTTLTEAFRRAVLRLFVCRELMDVETAQGMLAWPHSGFHVHDGVWVAADDRAFAVRLARYCARNPVALSRLAYQSDNATVSYHSDKLMEQLPWRVP